MLSTQGRGEAEAEVLITMISYECRWGLTSVLKTLNTSSHVVWLVQQSVIRIDNLKYVGSNFAL